jgi:hypothetical protein
MRRVLTTFLAVALLLGLGALAVLALPNASVPLAGAPAVSASAPEFQPEAPAATQNFNNIAMPLNSENQFTTAGLTFDADGLAAFVGAGVKQVLHWDSVTQQYQVRTIDPEFGNTGTNFALVVGGSYWVLLDSTATNIVSFVGDVPAQGSVKFDMATGTPCKYNQFSIPLDQASITDADALGASLGASQVLNWNASTQQYEIRTIDPEFGNTGTLFQVKIGYPYSACLPATSPAIWPQ